MRQGIRAIYTSTSHHGRGVVGPRTDRLSPGILNPALTMGFPPLRRASGGDGRFYQFDMTERRKKIKEK